MTSFELHPDYSGKTTKWLVDQLAFFKSDDSDYLGNRVFELEMSTVWELNRRGLTEDGKKNPYSQLELGKLSNDALKALYVETQREWNFAHRRGDEEALSLSHRREQEIYLQLQSRSLRPPPCGYDVIYGKKKDHKEKTDRATRFKILSRDKYTCQYCGRKAPDVVLEVDHFIPKSKGGTKDYSNLKTACFDCNRGKRDKVIG